MLARRWMKIGIVALLLCLTLQPLSTQAAPAGVWVGLTNESHRALAYHVTDARGTVLWPMGGLSPWLLITQTPGTGSAYVPFGQWLEWGESTASGIVDVHRMQFSKGGRQVAYYKIGAGLNLEPATRVTSGAHPVVINLANRSGRALAYHVTDAQGGTVVYPQGGISPWLLITASPGSGGASALPGQWLEWGDSTAGGIANVHSTQIPGGCQVLYFVILPGMNLGQDPDREPLCASSR